MCGRQADYPGQHLEPVRVDPGGGGLGERVKLDRRHRLDAANRRGRPHRQDPLVRQEAALYGRGDHGRVEPVVLELGECLVPALFQLRLPEAVGEGGRVDRSAAAHPQELADRRRVQSLPDHRQEALAVDPLARRLVLSPGEHFDGLGDDRRGELGVHYLGRRRPPRFLPERGRLGAERLGERDPDAEAERLRGRPLGEAAEQAADRERHG